MGTESSRSDGGARSLPRHPQVWWSRMKARWPVLVWLGALAAAIWLYATTGRQMPIQGMVEIRQEDASPLEDARLLSVQVRSGQAVKAGDVLAVFDASLLDAELAVARRDIEREARRMFGDADQRVRDLEDALRTERRDAAGDQAEFLAVEEELERLEDLLKKRLIDETAVVRYRTDRGRLFNLQAAHADTVRALEADLARAVATRDALAFGAGGPPASVAEAVGQLERLYALRRETYTLKAKQAGAVSAVHQQPGNVVGAGTPVVSITVAGSEAIAGFVPEWSREDLGIGTPVRVARAAYPGRLLTGRISAVNAEVTILPISFAGAQLPNIRGRRVVVDVDQPEGFVPGEGVMIYPGDPWWVRILKRRPQVAAAGEKADRPGGS